MLKVVQDISCKVGQLLQFRDVKHLYGRHSVVGKYDKVLKRVDVECLKRVQSVVGKLNDGVVVYLSGIKYRDRVSSG